MKQELNNNNTYQHENEHSLGKVVADKKSKKDNYRNSSAN